MSKHFSTQAVHAGEVRRKPYGALTTPIVQTSTYTFEDTAEVLSFMHDKAARTRAREQGGDLPLRDEYGRYSNPTQQAVEGKIAALEGGERALLFATGMSAITTTLLALLSEGDHVVMAKDCYRRTREFGEKLLPRWGIETTLVPLGDLPALDAAMRSNTRLVFTETPTNPYLRIADLPKVGDIAKRYNALTAIDSTFATPLNLQPMIYGIDLVIHSATKYLGGHNDVLAGVVVGSHSLISPIEAMRGVLGGVGSPHDAYLLIRGLKTLDLRVRQQNATALRIAQFLEAHPMIQRVHYPGLPSHPDHEVAQRLMSGFSGVVSFEVRGDKETAGRFVDRLRIPYIGPTLGGVESIVQQQALFISLNLEERRAAGISDMLVRYAVGIEDADDLIADLDQALAGL